METLEGPREICRTCLKQIVDGAVYHHLDSFEPTTELVKLQHKLISCVPELNLELATSMVVCGDCSAAISSAYNFKAKCLQTEMKIHKYLLQVDFTSSVDLSRITQAPKQTQLRHTKEIVNTNVETGVYSNGFASEYFTAVFIKEDRDDQQARFLQQQNDTLPFEAVDSDFMLSRASVTPTVLENVKEEPFTSVNILYRNRQDGSNDKQIANTNCKCCVCGFRCLSRTELNGHLKNHETVRLCKGEITKRYNSSKIYKCFLCRYLCKHKSSLFVHVRTHLTKAMYRQILKRNCLYKSKFAKRAKIKYEKEPPASHQFRFRRQQQRNFKNNTKPFLSKNIRLKRFRCVHCKYSSNRKSNLYVHIRIHSLEKARKYKKIALKHRTQLSMQNKTRRNNLQSYIKIPTKQKFFKCVHCPYKSSQKGNLKNHMIVHSEDKPFQCAHCDFRTAYKSSFERHLKIHTGEMPYKCTQCEYKTVNRGHLEDHKKVHAGEKPFQCGDCDFKTLYKNNFKRHLTMHTGQSPFNCTECQYKTTNKCHLINHSRIHTGEKPFKCTYCNFRTAHKSNFRSHVNLHTGQNLFRCAQCSYKTTRRGYFENHLRTHTVEKQLS